MGQVLRYSWLLVALSVAGCSSSGQVGSSQPSAPEGVTSASVPPFSASASTSTVDANASGTLTIWLEEPAKTQWPDAVALAANHFNTLYPNVKVNVVLQQWSSGYVAKVQTAIESPTPPDVAELGTSETDGIISQGLLADITADKGTFDNSSTWRTVLTQSCRVGGKLYCVPYYAAEQNGTILGGSELATPTTSQHRVWAEAWVKAFTATATERMFAQEGRYAPDGFTYLANTTSIS